MVWSICVTHDSCRASKRAHTKKKTQQKTNDNSQFVECLVFFEFQFIRFKCAVCIKEIILRFLGNPKKLMDLERVVLLIQRDRRSLPWSVPPLGRLQISSQWWRWWRPQLECSQGWSGSAAQTYAPRDGGSCSLQTGLVDPSGADWKIHTEQEIKLGAANIKHCYI